MKSTAEPTIVYVCAAARSGSTLLDMFLGGHPEATSLGELNFLGKAIALKQQCTCGHLVPECPEWHAVFERLNDAYDIDLLESPYQLRLWDALAAHVIDREHQTKAYRMGVKFRKGWFDLKESLPGALSSLVPALSAHQVSIENKLRLYELISTAWGKRVLIDSSKNQREAISLYRANPAHVRIVYLHRDGRGVFLSQMSNGRAREKSLDGWLAYNNWVARHFERKLPAGACFSLAYEDFATDPRGVGQSLCDFIGLDFDDRMLDLGQGERHMVNGNETRFAPKKGIALDERWRRDLKEDDLAFFDRCGGSALNRVLGYRA